MTATTLETLLAALKLVQRVCRETLEPCVVAGNARLTKHMLFVELAYHVENHAGRSGCFTNELAFALEELAQQRDPAYLVRLRTLEAQGELFDRAGTELA